MNIPLVCGTDCRRFVPESCFDDSYCLRSSRQTGAYCHYIKEGDLCSDPDLFVPNDHKKFKRSLPVLANNSTTLLGAPNSRTPDFRYAETS